jgi:hypothetical protein
MCTNMAPAIKSMARSGLAMQQSNVNVLMRASGPRRFNGGSARNTMIDNGFVAATFAGARESSDARSRRRRTILVRCPGIVQG